MCNNFFKSAKAKLLALYCVASTTCMTFLADAKAATDLGTNIESTGKKFLNEITAVYCNSLGWLVLGISLLIYAFAKDDRVVGYAKKAAWGSVIVYIILIILNGGPGNVIQTTVDSVQGWMGGVG